MSPPNILILNSSNPCPNISLSILEIGSNRIFSYDGRGLCVTSERLIGGEQYALDTVSWTIWLLWCLRYQFHLFFTDIGLLFGKNCAIWAHLFPKSLWYWNSNISSVCVHDTFEIVGQIWPVHLSRHCFPVLPETLVAMRVQLFVPNSLTASVKSLSSYGVHLVFIILCFVSCFTLGLTGAKCWQLAGIIIIWSSPLNEDSILFICMTLKLNALIFLWRS